MSRRLEKFNRTIRENVSGIIQNQLSDPRIRGMISVTRVATSADLRTARVYLSILGVDQTQQRLCVEAIQHACGFIQSRLAGTLHAKTCPTLSFFLDDSLKKALETIQLIEHVSAMNDRTEEQENETGLDEWQGDST